jgi:hypothetical protein
LPRKHASPLGVKEWGLELKEVYGDEKKEFLGHNVLPLSSAYDFSSETLIVCLYDKTKPMSPDYLPAGLVKNDKMVWVFSKVTDNSKKFQSFQLKT